MTKPIDTAELRALLRLVADNPETEFKATRAEIASRVPALLDRLEELEQQQAAALQRLEYDCSDLPLPEGLGPEGQSRLWRANMDATLYLRGLKQPPALLGRIQELEREVADLEQKLDDEQVGW